MRKVYCNSVIEGIVRGIILFLILDYGVSIYSVSVQMDIFVLIVGIMISFICSFFLLNDKELSKKKSVISFLIGTISFWIVNIFTFFNNFTLRFSAFPYREAEPAEGFIIIFLFGIYIIATMAFRMFLFVAKLLKKRVDSSPSETR